MGKQKYTDEFLISELKRFVDENGRVPTQKDMLKKNGYPSINIYRKSFGCWNNALKEANLTPKNTQYVKKYTKKFLINELQRFYKENGRSPKCEDFKASNGYPANGVYNKYFGSFNDALIEANLDVNCLRKFSYEFLISELQRFYKENNKNPGVCDLTRNNGYPSIQVYYKYFDSLESALLAANLNIYTYTKESLINDIYKFIDIYSRVPNIKDLTSECDMHCSQTYAKEFGSWNLALIYAGVDINKNYVYDKLFLISELKRFYKENGRSPKVTDLTFKNGYPSMGAYNHHFTTFNDALIEAGLEINKVIAYDYAITPTCTTCKKPVKSHGNRDEDGNFICRTCWTKIWRKHNYNKFLKSQHKRRGYGFTELNKKFKGSHAHHLHLENRTDFIIYIPNFIHEMHFHNHDIESTMTTPNALALDFFINEELYKKYLTGEMNNG